MHADFDVGRWSLNASAARTLRRFPVLRAGEDRRPFFLFTSYFLLLPSYL
jgi:hypothetical protein